MTSARWFLAVTVVVVSAMSHAQAPQGTDGSRVMSREERIAAHQAKINDILAASRLVQANTISTSESALQRRAPLVTMPGTFDNVNVSLLHQVNASKDQIERLRQINEELWNMRDKADQATAPEVSSTVKALLSEQAKVLSPEQQKAYDTAYAAEMEQRQKQAQVRQSSASSPTPSR